MPQPPAYNRAKDFSSNYGDQTDGAAINSEFDKVSSSITGVRSNLALIQQDDGGLKAGVVTADSLDPAFRSEITESIAAGLDDQVAQAQSAANDASIAAGISTSSATSAQGYAQAALTSAGSAQASAQAASASQSGAFTSATAASAGAVSASASAGAASASATSAANSATSATGSATSAGNASTSAIASRDAAAASAAGAGSSAAAALVSEHIAQGYYEQMQASGGLPVVAANAIPTSDIGPIYVVGQKLMTFTAGRYAPNNLSQGYRAGGNLGTGLQPFGGGEDGGLTLNIQAFALRDTANTVDLIAPVAISKTFNAAAWTSGNGGNLSFDGSRTAGNIYDVYAIRNDTTGAIDVGAQSRDLTNLNPINPNLPPAALPAGWSSYRLLGSVYVNGSAQMKAFFMRGRDVTWCTPAVRLANAGIPAGVLTFPTNTPPGRSSTVRLAVGLFTGVLCGIGIYAERTSIGTNAFAGSIASGSTQMPIGGSVINVAVSDATLATLPGLAYLNRVFATTMGVASTSDGLYISEQGYTDSKGDY